uniref:Uncharacterized protein n=1 Tax=Oryza rufipogon TaxID=4529 RepID=A0A0E0QQL2_ORYRU
MTTSPHHLGGFSDVATVANIWGSRETPDLLPFVPLLDLTPPPPPQLRPSPLPQEHNFEAKERSLCNYSLASGELYAKLDSELEMYREK